MRDLIRNLADDLDTLSRADSLNDVERALMQRLSRDASKIDDAAGELHAAKADLEFYKRRTEELLIQVQNQERQIASLMTSPETLKVLERAAGFVNVTITDNIRAQGRLQEMLQMMAAGQMINAIKIARSSAGLGLKEAKDYIDAVRDFRPTMPVEITRGGEPDAVTASDIPF